MTSNETIVIEDKILSSRYRRSYAREDSIISPLPRYHPSILNKMLDIDVMKILREHNNNDIHSPRCKVRRTEGRMFSNSINTST